MSKTSEQTPESPAQVHLKGPGGMVVTYDRDRIGEHIRRQWERGELQRVNADGTPYTGRAR